MSRNVTCDSSNILKNDVSVKGIIRNNSALKCLKTTRPLFYFVELVTYIIPNISTMFKHLAICNFTQGNGAFYLVAYCYNFRERVRKEVSRGD